MRAKGIRVGQIFRDGVYGVFVLTFADHDPEHCYVTYRKLWLWHVNMITIGRQPTGGSPWEAYWPYELVCGS